MKKRVIIVVSAIVCAVGLLTAGLLIALANDSKGSSDTYATRAEWISLLSTNFGLITYEQEQPYYSDVQEGHEAYTYVQACREWSILRDTEEFNPAQPATVEFVAETAILAAMLDNNSLFADMTSAQLLQYAFDKGIVSSKTGSNKVTVAECAAVVERITACYLNLEFEEYANIEIKEDVIDLSAVGAVVTRTSTTSSSREIVIEDDTVYLSPEMGKDIAEGTIFIIPGDYSGVAKKAVSVDTVDGQVVVQTATPELEEVFDELEFSFIGAPAFEDITPLQEGVVIVQPSEVVSTSLGNESGKVISLGNHTAVETKNKKKSINFDIEINLTKGKLTPNVAFTDFFKAEAALEYEKFFGKKMTSEAGEILKKTHTVMRYDKKGNLILEKEEEWKAGYEITGKLKVKDLYIEVECENNLKSLSSKLHFTIDSSLKIKGNLSGSVPIYETVIPGPAGVWVKVIFSVYVDVNGELTVGAEIEHTSNVTYKNKKFKTVQDTNYGTTVGLSASISTGVKGEIVPTALGIELIDISAKAGASIEGSTTLHQNAQDSMICMDIKLHYPTVSLSIGAKEKTVAYKLGIKATLKLVDKSGALIKSSSKTLWHYEISGDGANNVKKCTWGTSVNTGNFSGNGGGAGSSGGATKPTTEPTKQPSEPSNATEATIPAETPTQPPVVQKPAVMTAGDLDVHLEAPTWLGLFDSIHSISDADLYFTILMEVKGYEQVPVGGDNEWNTIYRYSYPISVLDNWTKQVFGTTFDFSHVKNSGFEGVDVTYDTANDTLVFTEQYYWRGAGGYPSYEYVSHSMDGSNYIVQCNRNLEGDTSTVLLTFYESDYGFALVSAQTVPSAPNEDIPSDLKFELTSDGTSYIVSGVISKQITSVVIPSVYSGLPVTGIGKYAFTECYNLTSVVIENGITLIDSNAFDQCTGLTSITLPDSITTIANYAFNKCSALSNVSVGSRTTSIGHKAFYWCTALKRIEIDANNPQYSSDERGVLFDKNKSTLLLAPQAIEGGYAIPNGVIEIGAGAFWHCSKITSLTIPDGVVTIGMDALRDCKALTSVSIPASLTTIGDYAFRYSPVLGTIKYRGTMEQWASISKGANWHENVPATEVICSDGTVSIS